MNAVSEKVTQSGAEDGIRRARQGLDAAADCLLAKSAEGFTRAPTPEEQAALQQDHSIEVNEISLARMWNKAKGYAEYHAHDGKVWFRDHGPRIEMVNVDDESIVAALRVAAEKFGGVVTLSGPPEFRERAARLAAHLEIGVLDDDLSEVVDQEKTLLGNLAEEEEQARCGIGR